MVRRTAISALNPKAKDALQRGIDEHTRRTRGVRAFVVARLASGHEPTVDDFAAAMEEAPGEPIPPELVDYAAKMARRQQRKRGPKVPTRTMSDELAMIAFYQAALLAFTDAHDADATPATRDVKRRAARLTAKVFGWSKTTVDRLIAARRLHKTPPK